MVVPTYNDLDSLNRLIELIELEKTSSIVYLIVNNGSTDSRIEESLRRESDFWKSITLRENAGFGGGIIAGINAADTEWIGWMPGNLKIQPKDVSSLVNNLEYQPNLFVKCHRRRASKIAQTKTFIAGLVQSLLTGENLFDTGGTPTLCQKKFFLSLRDLPTDYVIESRMLYEARAHRMRIVRPEIPYGERVFGNSHWQRGIKSEARLMKAITLDSLRVRRRHFGKKKISQL